MCVYAYMFVLSVIFHTYICMDVYVQNPKNATSHEYDSHIESTVL